MTRRLAPEIEARLAAGEPVVLVTVEGTQGSAPRASGARMAVAAEASFGTIGGGRLEWEAIGRAREMIAEGGTAATLDMALGPAVGQCCGGHVVLRLARADKAALAALAEAEAQELRESPEIVVCGAGHVGRALVWALEALPVRVLWADARQDVFPDDVGDNVEIEASDPVAAVRGAGPGAAIVAMTHSHALDYEITGAALRRGDLAYVGLIGSRTKRRRFERWFTARYGEVSALDRLVCPIGDVGVGDKRPEVIAALVAAELVQALDRRGALAGAAAPERLTKEAVR